MNTRLKNQSVRQTNGTRQRRLLDALGKFDLDPCAPIRPLWPTARSCMTRT